MNVNYPLTRKETFSVSLVIFIGFYYLYTVLSVLIPARGIPEGYSRIMAWKYLLLGLFYWWGAIYFYLLRPAGWVICTASVLNFVMVVFNYLAALLQSGRTDALTLMAGICLLLVITCFLFLLSKETRSKFSVSNKSYLLAIGVYGLLLAATYIV